MRTNLKVPFKDNQKVKSLGAWWDDARKTWYVENLDNLTVFLPWIGEKLKKPVHQKSKSKSRVNHPALKGEASSSFN